MTKVGERMRNGGSSVRARTTAGAVMAVGLALLIASIALVVLMQRTMERNVTSAARLRALDVVASIEANQSFPDLMTRDDDVFVQIIDGKGKVLASSPSLEGVPVVAQLHPGESTIIQEPPIDDDDPFSVVAEEARTSTGSLMVLVGRNLDLVRESISSITLTLLTGVPLLLLVVAFTTWSVTGRSLSPVESMRKEVAGISQADLHRRLPLPSGNDEVARLARTLNGMLERLDETRKREQRFVSDASHELRNPIAAIRHLTEVALAHPAGTSLEVLAEEVLFEDLRLQNLAEGLLLLARADERTLEVSAVPLDLDDLVLDEARRLKQTTSLRIETAGVNAARTKGDRVHLQRVIQNLADNAARHATSIVSFSVQEVERHVSLRVDDDGPGVPVGSREFIFERFARLDHARDRKHGGTGLGLAIVAEIVAAHEGRTSVQESPLGGARFEVFLPSGS
ncbi:MAG: HAMP domain-containing histidine kinase [Actinomycetota bacterium]|nr:HAMP domain-containing histidine kinase [Actinomycetota bacterium]